MANDNSRPDVAVFVDFENVYVSVRDKLDANPDFEAIMDRCSELGRVVISRAYADWYRYPRVTSALYANGVEPMYVPTYYYDKEMGRTGRAIKNSADMNMCIDAMKTLFTNTNIAKFVLVTGDRDFIPLVNMIRQQGKDVIIIGIGGAASSHLAQSADEFIFYEQLVGKTAAPAAREVNRERPRPERTRPVESESVTPVAPVVPATPSVPITPVVTAPAQPEHPAELDPFDTLVEAVHLARKRGYVCTLGSLKLVMKELMGGDFKESRYKDLSGRPFAKFKDFVLDAERRGKVQIFTNGTINEVFLPGEDPYKLSQFASDLKEETPVAVAPIAPVPTNGRKPAAAATAPVTPAEAAATNGRSRRRRRSRGGRQADQTTAEALAAIADTEGVEELEELEEIPDEQVSEADSLVAALMPEDFFDPDVVLSDLSEDEVEAGHGMLIPDDLIDLPSDDYVAEQDLADLDTLEPIEEIDTIDTHDFADTTVLDVGAADEAELLAEAEAIDQNAAALVAEMREQDQQEVTPEVEQAEQEFAPSDADEAILEVEQEALALVPSDEGETTPEIVQAEQELSNQDASSDEDGIPPESAQVEETFDEGEATPEVEQEALELASLDEGTGPSDVEQAVQGLAPPDDSIVTPDVEQAAAELAPPDETSGSAESATADVSSETEQEDASALPVETVVFTDEEWGVFRELMSAFTRPVSFAQIFDSLRTYRQQQRLTRTNEQLRTLVKQAINTGLLERSGRGTRIYYRLAENA